MEPQIQTPPPQSLPPIANQPGSSKKNLVMILIILAVVLIGGGAAYYFLYYEKSEPTDNVNDAITVVNSNSNENSAVNTNSSIVNVNSTVSVNVASNINTVTNTSVNASTNLNTNSIDESVDSDGDGINDYLEIWYGTAIDEKDSDGDGHDDRTEVDGCYNPTGMGRMTADNFKYYCRHMLNDGFQEWNFTEVDKINDVCEVYQSHANEMIDATITGIDIFTEYDDDTMKAILDDKCTILKSLLTEDETDEDNVCSFMELASLFCIFPMTN